MTYSMRMVGVAGVVAVGMMLAACPPTQREGAGLVGGGGGAARHERVEEPPVVVAGVTYKMEKPKVLGPVNPAIVLLPERMAEPVIRVRLTAEREGGAPDVRGYQGKYRGRVEAVKLPNGKYVVVNTLPMDAYLQGVLAKELYGGWNVETYEAQAIAARTFALFQLVTGDSKGRAWDLANDESAQMYGGMAGETAKSRSAVAATKGQVMFAEHNGKEGLFCAFYSACSGVASQDPFEAWGDASVGVLRARNLGDVDSISADKFNWGGMVLSKSDITRCVQAWGKRNEVPYLAAMGAIRKVAVGKRNAVTGRPIEFALTDARGTTVPMRAEEFRLAMIYDPAGSVAKPYSSHFDVQDAGESIVLVNGHGFGHGIGMSQWGAEALARKGSTHTQILAYYYPGAALKQEW